MAHIVKVGHLPNMALVPFALERAENICLIAQDDRTLAEFEALIPFFTQKCETLVFPAWDCRPYDRLSPRPDISARRAFALARLASGFSGILLTTENAVMQKLMPLTVMKSTQYEITTGKNLDIKALHHFAQNVGYLLAPTVRAPGEYAVRGGIVDIFPPGQEAPIRVDLWGDVVDRMREFDPETQRSAKTIDHVVLLPSNEIQLGASYISNFRTGYRALVGVPKTDDPFFEPISAGQHPQGVDHYLPLFYETLSNFADYLPEDMVLFSGRDLFENIDARFMQISETHAQQIGPRIPLPPERLYQDKDAFLATLKERKIYLGHAASIVLGANAIDAGYHPARDFTSERMAQDARLYPALQTHLIAQQARGVLIAANSKGSAERLRGVLDEYDFHPENITSHQDLRPNQIALTHLGIRSGFALPNGYEILSEGDIFGERLGRKRQKKSAIDILSDAATLVVGDYVVHQEHGIARFEGLRKIKAAGAVHECLELLYQGDDRLFLPVENIDLITPYAEENPNLDRLGSAAWQERKARAKKDLLKMAEGLIKIAAERDLREAPKMEAPSADYEHFVMNFPFEETEDQQAAIDDTLADLASGRPMDRLVCGDVGFGKTEIALRAAFAAASSGHQVAVIAPTTLLARQHGRNFHERFSQTGLILGELSRLVPQKEIKATKKALAAGQLDIVVGTHAVLSDDTIFKNLGLLIIDEEQHFGVKHKEKIKALRSSVHVLTLSATPIPRTLQLALSGVRELSLITTPPIDRLAIRSFVAPFDAQMIRDALMHECRRGGQSFYVVPRISDLAEVEEFLTQTCPELRFITAHGQMSGGELDQRMNDFYEGRADILLATSIIESGLDIPRANTLIVHRADMFGLAQLYQIRGRVGRSKLRAYAYLTTKDAKLTPSAEKRLALLSRLDALGSGFSLASHDLDMRGAGNLLGEEQSGRIREIGFALYQSMLKEAIQKLRAGDQGESLPDDPLSPKINIGVTVMIPETYIPDLDTRLSLYRRIAQLDKKSAVDDFRIEMVDRFGKLPEAVDKLLAIVRIKSFARIAGIAELDAGANGAKIRFHHDRFANPQGLVEWIGHNAGRIKVDGTKIIMSWHASDERTRIKETAKLASELAKCARLIS